LNINASWSIAVGPPDGAWPTTAQDASRTAMFRAA